MLQTPQQRRHLNIVQACPGISHVKDILQRGRTNRIATVGCLNMAEFQVQSVIVPNNCFVSSPYDSPIPKRNRLLVRWFRVRIP